MSLKLRQLFRRKPKGYRFPNGIPRVEVTGSPTGGTYTVKSGGRTETYDHTGKLIEVTFPAVDEEAINLLKADPEAYFDGLEQKWQKNGWRKNGYNFR